MTKTKKIAVVLSGCGVYDGAEIHEAVCSMLAIAEAGAEYDLYAPDIDQHHVINHLNGSEMPEKRNVLVEAARIARGNIKALSKLQVEQADALLLPGGFGAAKNLSSFAFDGADCKIEPQTERVVRSFHQAGKPIAALCIAPVVIAKILGDVEVTIGSDKATAAAIETMGGQHTTTGHGQVVTDTKNKLITTPCYMLDATLPQIATGARAAVTALLNLIP